eukprot:TRINITY_DN1703_c0_g1_i4.p1 TRINITY_DN1703_c0_g1~~TRINITY_DN1703_c0_g1_i4.p1  ORF type:complete len:420 (-),score=91.12 TRINITY_DN1703_c0_g1_i4:112-1371(-)
MSIFSRKKKTKPKEPEERPNPFLAAAESSMFKHLPNLRAKPMLSTQPTAVLAGPSAAAAAASYGDLASACSVSTYPHVPGEPVRAGDPICDQYRVNLYENRAIVCIADGCNWGPKVLEAANRASNEFVDYLHERLPGLTETKQFKKVLIDAMQAAHVKIFEGKVDQDGHWWDVGQTTLLGGVLVPIDKGTDRWSPGYEFLCVSVGDCKGFCYTNGQMQDITDLTMRADHADARDSGGRLGPATEVPESDILQLPDLANLSLFSVPCEEGDLVLLMTDGVHDNLDPQHLGKKPRDMPKSMCLGECDEWSQVDREKAEQAKNVFRIAFLEKQVEGAAKPDDLCSTLLDHCVKTTSASRKFMCENQGRIVPKDYALFPGKMDHSSIVAFKVGPFPPLSNEQATMPDDDDDPDAMVDLGSLAM